MAIKAMKQGVLFALVLCMALAELAHGLWLDEERSLYVTGKLSHQGSWRTSHAQGFTEPRIKRGNLIQSRSLVDMEFAHTVDRWLETRYDVDLPFKLNYRIRVKAVYDGITDYGPDSLNQNTNPDPGLLELDHLKILHDGFPWNAYVNIGFGPANLRVGRQDLSWGETDGFRLLDMIQPLDNRFGFPLIEDLDDRRIPLWMARAVVALDFLRTSWLSNPFVDLYWVPGQIDDQESPLIPAASPFSANQPRPPVAPIVIIPEKEFDSSRGGGRFVGILFQQFTFSLAHYYTWNDIPSVRVLATRNFLSANPFPADIDTEVEFYQQQISGGSVTGAIPFDPLTILRLEVAMFWSERISEASDLSEETIGSLIEGAIVTGLPQTTTHHNRNVLRWMLGFDRNIWMRWLNPNTTIFLTGQFFNTHVLNPPNDLAVAATHPETLNPLRQRSHEMLLIVGGSTNYLSGYITPSPAIAYDPRGTVTVIPGFNWNINTNWTLGVKYANVMGVWHGLGLFKDRDTLWVRLTYGIL